MAALPMAGRKGFRQGSGREGGRRPCGALPGPTSSRQILMIEDAPVTDATPDTLTPEARERLEAAAFRRLVAHLRERTDVQNIDLMTLAGFCRNCLSNWVLEAAQAEGLPLTKDQSREAVYGMSYEDWKALHQREATPAQQAAFEAAKPGH